MSADDEEFLQLLREAFAIEAAEHLQSISVGILELENRPEAPRKTEIIEVIFRAAHSLKGAARSVDRADIEAACQALESIFSAWKSGSAEPARGHFDLLSRAVDYLDALVKNGASPAKQGALNALVQELRAVDLAPSPVREKQPAIQPNEKPAAPEAPPEKLAGETVRIATAKMDSLLLQAEEMLPLKGAAQQRAVDLRDLGLTLEIWQKEWARLSAELQRRRTHDGAGASPKVVEFLEWNHAFVRSLEAKILTLTEAAQADSRTVNAMIGSLLEDAKTLLLLPFSTLLQLFPKLVRDLARDQQKEVELVVTGREIEIDKRLLEEMKDPLIHLVRNAIDHGIEGPAARHAKGKKPRAVVTIAVTQIDSSTVEIVVRDDGAGIAMEEVRASAVKRGLLSAEAAAARSDQEALALIFHSGVSTRESVTEISGRGLGMAIVREKVEKLGGQIAIETKADRGTTFRIILPVTLATFPGLIVRAGGQQFVVPLSNIERVLRVRRDEIQFVDGRATISWQEKTIAVARLEEVLGMPKRRRSDEGKFLPTIILGAGATRVAFAVDEIGDEQEILVKRLPKPLVRVRHIAGATVLGTGKIVLILNVPDLLKTAATLAPTDSLQAKMETTTRSILVADDSVTSRMLLKNILDSAGYEVKTASDGLDAWARLRTAHFDLVVSDVEMPRMNGFDLTAHIRADKRLAGTPVVLVTALESREARERGAEAGASAYIVKSSFEQSDLLAVVRRLL